jgi:hypothetical protein
MSIMLNPLPQELDFVTSEGYYVDQVISEGSIYYRRCLQALRYLSTKYRILPSSMIMRDVAREHLPVSGGGFAVSTVVQNCQPIQSLLFLFTVTRISIEA